MTIHETKKIVEATLDPYDELKDLECDGFTRVASYLLRKMGIEHVVMLGSLEMLGHEVEPHFWIILEESGLIIDYRARMWLDDKPEAPHGVFIEEDFPLAHYYGQETKVMTSKVVFDILTRRVDV